MDRLKLITAFAFMLLTGAALTTGAYVVGTETETHINVVIERAPTVQIEKAVEQETGSAVKPAKDKHPTPSKKPPVPPTPVGIHID